MPWVKLEAARDSILGSEDEMGVFERILGFRTATHSIKIVHIMNDCAQTLLGGVPASSGDFICRLIRQDKDEEPNSEDQLRGDAKFGARFSNAFPRALGSRQVRALRTAITAVLNHDGGVYRAGDRMASALATHSALLGAESFRRFRIGAYLVRILADAGRERLLELLTSDRDPLTRALRPLLIDEPLVESGPQPGQIPVLSKFDVSLGRRLSWLLCQPLTKPTLLRAFALGASLGLVLKILGVGREGGRPLVLALGSDDDTSPARPLREEAVQSFQRARDALDAAAAGSLMESGVARLYTRSADTAGAAEVSGGQKAGAEIVSRLREAHDPKMYWPEEFAAALGRKAGCILPKSTRAGWGAHVALNPEITEVLTLMSVEPGGRPMPWTRLWNELRNDLGIVIGAAPVVDAEALRDIGVLHVSAQRLRDNAVGILRGALRRGGTRRLPDGGAEALGAT